MLPQLSEADAIVLAYCDRSAFLKTLDVVCDALLGEAPVAVDPPAQDVHVKTGETHTFSILSLARCPAARLPVSVTDAYPVGLAVSYDVTDAIKRVEWDFGDGKRGKGLRVEHAYTEAGRYPVTVSVADVTGDETSRTWHVVAE
jgi:PKD repeat protein